jgi:3-oxoacyl-[acyl-carrier protein] reductase
MNLGGKVAIVTGAAGGIGEKTARKFIEDGAIVIITDLDQGKLELLEQEFGQEKVMVFAGDLIELDQIDALVRKALAKFGRIDILVNAAGICEFISFEEITSERWDRMLSINLKTVFFLSRAVSEVMVEQQSGKIINIASIAGEYGSILSGAHYCASKAGVINLTKSFAKVLAGNNIQVNVVSPGPVETPMWSIVPEQRKIDYVAQIPLKKIATPEDIAEAIYFLAAPSSDYITGEVLRVNGGLLM